MDDATDKPPYPEWPEPRPFREVERDTKGRIMKGSTGNPRGRPPKRVRPSSTRELMREFISEMERNIEVGGEEMTVTRFLIKQRVMKAAKGDQREAAKLLDEYQKALVDLARMNEGAAAYLEAVEKRLGHREGEIKDRETREFLYEARRSAKRL